MGNSGGKLTRKLISSGTDFELNIGYYRAVADGGMVFGSGATGYNYKDMSLGNDVAVQAEQCFVNIQSALKEAGSSIEDIVRVNYILSNRDDFEGCWPVTGKWLGAVRPAAPCLKPGC